MGAAEGACVKFPFTMSAAVRPAALPHAGAPPAAELAAAGGGAVAAATAAAAAAVAAEELLDIGAGAEATAAAAEACPPLPQAPDALAYVGAVVVVVAVAVGGVIAAAAAACAVAAAADFLSEEGLPAGAFPFACAVVAAFSFPDPPSLFPPRLRPPRSPRVRAEPPVCSGLRASTTLGPDPSADLCWLRRSPRSPPRRSLLLPPPPRRVCESSADLLSFVVHESVLFCFVLICCL